MSFYINVFLLIFDKYPHPTPASGWCCFFRFTAKPPFRVKDALEKGGDDRAMQLGQDIGELVWHVGSIATGVGGGAKGGVALAKTGI